MFVRTKQNIIHEVSCKDKDGYFVITGKYNGHKTTMYLEERQVIAKADTIEELCDRFVLVGAGLYRTVNLEIEDLIDNERPCYNSLEEILHSGHIVYGAIWADKGLIYVAKMNDKGELELIC